MALPNLGMDFTAFDPLTAAEMDDLVENIEALAAGTGLNDSAVITAKIAAGAVTPAKLATGADTVAVATAEGTTSTFPVDLATAGPAVTVTIGANGLALVSISASIYSSAELILGHMGFAMSGANTLTADLNRALTFGRTGAAAGNLGGSTSPGRFGATFLMEGLTPGSTTFTTKYGEEGGGTAVFGDRRIAVVPL